MDDKTKPNRNQKKKLLQNINKTKKSQTKWQTINNFMLFTYPFRKSGNDTAFHQKLQHQSVSASFRIISHLKYLMIGYIYNCFFF